MDRKTRQFLKELGLIALVAIGLYIVAFFWFLYVLGNVTIIWS